MCEPKHVGVKEFFYDFNVFFNKYVHELVTIDTIMFEYLS